MENLKVVQFDFGFKCESISAQRKTRKNTHQKTSA